MATNNNDLKKLLETKQYTAMTVLTNLLSFKDWKFAAYRLEEHEKDIVIEALGCFRESLEQKLDKLQEETNDSSELCE